MKIFYINVHKNTEKPTGKVRKKLGNSPGQACHKLTWTHTKAVPVPMSKLPQDIMDTAVGLPRPIYMPRADPYFTPPVLPGGHTPRSHDGRDQGKRPVPP